MNNAATQFATAAELRQALTLVTTALGDLRSNLLAQDLEHQAVRPTEAAYQGCMDAAGSALMLARATLTKALQPAIVLDEDSLVILAVSLIGVCQLAEQHDAPLSFFNLCQALADALEDQVSSDLVFDEPTMTRRLRSFASSVLTALGKPELPA